MESAAAVGANARAVSMPMSSSLRKEWHAVPEHHLVRNSANEEVERSKLGQSDERTLYEVQQEREQLVLDFCSITIDGNLDDEILQQRVHSIARQRVELQQMEMELRAQVIARAEIMEIQNSFDVQIKEHANTVLKCQEQLHERDHTIHELERKIEEKDRELHAIKLDNEAAWAKEDLLREQNKELANFRRDRDHSEAERSQHIQQIHDLQQHVQEKERQLMDLQEQHRVAQDTIIYKDEQLREAQAWIAHVQEMDVLQSTSLQAELRERTEQLNQLWHGWQRQFAEMERYYMHAIQQLQLELADAKSGSYNDELCNSQTNSKDVSQFGQKNTDQLDVNGSSASSGSLPVLSNGNSDNVPSFVSTANASNQMDHVPGIHLTPSSLFGMPSYFPPGQVTAVHPFVMHQQGVPHSVPLQIPESHVGHFHSVAAISSVQQWQNQQVLADENVFAMIDDFHIPSVHQAVTDGSQISMHNHHPSSQIDQSASRSDTNYDYEMSADRQTLHPEYLDVHISQGIEPNSVNPSSSGEAQVHESIDRSYTVAPKSEQSLQQISSQFHDALRLDPLQVNKESKEQQTLTLTNHVVEGHGPNVDQSSSVANTLPSDATVHSGNPVEMANKNTGSAILPQARVSTGLTNTLTTGRTPESILLDERSLLACIVRTIPAGGRIRISATLPNRLAKMLAPLHWHDYKKLYGKLDDFVASHLELFVIEDDYIQLREGAQEMIAATAAVAKVAAAAAALSPFSSILPSVSVTPMAQSHRLKNVPSSDSKYKNVSESNGLEIWSSQPSALTTVGNGSSPDRTSVSSNRNKGSTNGRAGANLVGKPPGRTIGTTTTSRR